MAGFAGGSGGKGSAPKGPPPKASGGAPVAPQPTARPVQVPHSTPGPAAHAAAANPLAGLGQGNMTGQQLFQAASALASAKYDPSLHQLASAIAQQNAQAANATKLTTGYFNGVNALAQNAVTQEGNIASGVNSQLGALGTGLAGQLQAIGSGAQDLTQQYAPQGTNIAADSGATSQLASAIAEQKGLAAQQAAGVQAQGITQGGNWEQLANMLGPADAALGRQELTSIREGNAAKVQPLNQKIGVLEGERQVGLLNNITALRNQETKNNYDAGTLAVREQGVRTTAAHDRTMEGLKQQSNQIAEQKQTTLTPYQRGVLELAGGKLGVAQKNASTSAYKATHLSPYQAGVLGLDQQKLTTLTPYQQGQLADQRVRLRIQGVDAQTAAKRVGLLGTYDAARTQQGWDLLSLKQQTQLATESYHQQTINLKRAQQGVGAKPLTTLQNNTATLTLNQAVGYIRGEQGHATRQQIDQALSSGVYATKTGQTRGIKTAVNPVLIQAAHELLGTGTVTAATAKAMKQMGMRGTTFNGQPIKVMTPSASALTQGGKVGKGVLSPTSLGG